MNAPINFDCQILSGDLFWGWMAPPASVTNASGRKHGTKNLPEPVNGMMHCRADLTRKC
jgi:hypothetical protein